MMSSATTESSCLNQYWFNSASSWRQSGRRFWRDTDRRSPSCIHQGPYFTGIESRPIRVPRRLIYFNSCIYFSCSQICPRGELPVCGLVPIHTIPKVLLGIVFWKFIPIIKFIYNKTFMTIKDEYSLTIFEYKVAVQISENHLNSLIHL